MTRGEAMMPGLAVFKPSPCPPCGSTDIEDDSFSGWRYGLGKRVHYTEESHVCRSCKAKWYSRLEYGKVELLPVTVGVLAEPCGHNDPLTSEDLSGAAWRSCANCGTKCSNRGQTFPKWPICDEWSEVKP